MELVDFIELVGGLNLQQWQKDAIVRIVKNEETPTGRRRPAYPPMTDHYRRLSELTIHDLPKTYIDLSDDELRDLTVYGTSMWRTDFSEIENRILREHIPHDRYFKPANHDDVLDPVKQGDWIHEMLQKYMPKYWDCPTDNSGVTEPTGASLRGVFDGMVTRRDARMARDRILVIDEAPLRGSLAKLLDFSALEDRVYASIAPDVIASNRLFAKGYDPSLMIYDDLLGMDTKPADHPSRNREPKGPRGKWGKLK